jgi:hypothetical protein
MYFVPKARLARAALLCAEIQGQPPTVASRFWKQAEGRKLVAEVRIKIREVFLADTDRRE